MYRYDPNTDELIAYARTVGWEIDQQPDEDGWVHFTSPDGLTGLYHFNDPIGMFQIVPPPSVLIDFGEGQVPAFVMQFDENCMRARTAQNLEIRFPIPKSLYDELLKTGLYK